MDGKEFESQSTHKNDTWILNETGFLVRVNLRSDTNATGMRSIGVNDENPHVKVREHLQVVRNE